MATQIQTGSSLVGTSVSGISESMNTHRTCTIEITNQTGQTLFDPNHHCHSGYCHTPLQPVIAPWTREACGFSKNSEAPTGCVGVFTYCLENLSLRMAVMFSVPYDCNLYENWFGLAFLDAGDVADEALYKNMYNSKEFQDRPDRQRAKAKSGITLHVENDGWKISATMSEAKKAIIHVEVTSTHKQQMPAPYPFQPQAYSYS